MPNVTKLFLTTLPNGITSDGKRLQMTVLLSPQEVEGGDTGGPFANWPEWSGADTPGWNNGWKVSINGSTNYLTPIVVPRAVDGTGDLQARIKQQTANDSDLWRYVFDGYLTSGKKKRDLKDLSKLWVLSHRAHAIHEHLDDHRHIYAQMALPQAKIAGNEAQLKILNDAAAASRYFMQLYLHPKVGINGPGEANLQKELTAATQAKNFFNKGMGPIFMGVNAAVATRIARRINHGLRRLAQDPDRRLRGTALLALYTHAAKSVATNNPLDVETIASVRTVANITTEVASPIYDPGITGMSTQNVVDKIQNFVEFHLFHRRTKNETRSMHAMAADCPPDTRDFHTMLARVNQFPAMLRPLHLAVDLELEVPDVAITTISVTNTTVVDGLTPTPRATSLVTNCTVVRSADRKLADFYPTANGMNLFLNTTGSSRYLNLQAQDLSYTTANKLVFQFVTEDTDGSAQKTSEQSNAQLRAGEYQSTASATSSAASTPSGRSVGVTLLYTKRGDRTQQALKKNADLQKAADSGTVPANLSAEDLVLGYRVDVKRTDVQPGDPPAKGMWRSLCARTGTYEILDAAGSATMYKYEPAPGLESAADEGFVSPMSSTPVSMSAGGAAPSATDPNADPDPLVQVHQSLFTWTGWSLSVRPLFDSMAASKSQPKCPEPPKRIKPKYEIAKGSLPPLRFARPYKFRCRVVDLAGNSSTLEAPASALADYTPIRVEPVRPPHVLLTRPLPRVSHPGEQADVLVIRDGGASSSRILAATRETVRMAELHDQLNSQLPTDAFSGAILMPNGSFPSVAMADKENILPDPPNGTSRTPEGKPKTWNDSIFLTRRDNRRPDCPYLPDYLAKWILISPSLTREDLTEADPYKPVYLGLYEDPDYADIGKSTWPDCGPVRLTLADYKGTPEHVIKRAMVTDDDVQGAALVRGLSILVPKARTVTVQISSAMIDPKIEDKAPMGARTKLVALFDRPDFSNVFNVQPADIQDGTNPAQTPPHKLTLVHAVRTPLAPPAFKDGFNIQRKFGATAADVKGDIIAEWFSTGKVSCHATWEDQVDDPKQKKLQQTVKTSEAAFELLAIGGDGKVDANGIPISRQASLQAHHFRDTRAHQVTYSLQAATRFRDFYPADEKPSLFQVDGKTRKPGETSPWGVQTITVNSSIRPPAPSIAYIVPAFQWEDGYQSATETLAHGRISTLRIYLERPFLVSGDREGIGFVLPPAGGASPTVLDLCSRRGLDPIWGGADKAGSTELSAQDFAGGGPVATGCLLAETSATVDVVPYEVTPKPERNMWSCDVRIDSKDAYYPFVRLGVVRYQPDSIRPDPTHGVTDDVRISPVVVADFTQLAPNRWLHLQKKDGKTYSLAISGVTYGAATAAPDSATYPACTGNPPSPTHSTFTITVQQRWHAIGKDLGWRPVSCAAIPNCAFSKTDGVTVWRYDLHLPHSSSTHKYRLLIEEYEWFNADETPDLTGPSATPQSRLIYADFIEL